MKPQAHLFLTLFLSAALAACSHGPSERQIAAQRAAVRVALQHHALGAPLPTSAASSRAGLRDSKRSREIWKQTRAFYDSHDDALLWSDGKTPNARREDLTRAIARADEEGLDPNDYQLGSFDPEHAAESDVQATYAFFDYAADVSHGTIAPEVISPEWHPTPRRVDAAAALSEAVESGAVQPALDKLAPHTPQYAGLKHQLAVCPGEACRQTIAMNMDRWRWLPDDLGARYLIVNIPAFQLDAIENGKSVLQMKVVTGKKNNATPVLADEMETVVFSPYWNIPDSIVKNEILPKLEKDPGYLSRENMEADQNGHYRQLPGKGNSLGGVKFLFPNHFNVYLHDTPSRKLFERIERDFSHGCVRVEQPLELAKYVLRDQPEWTEDRIKAAMVAGVERSVRLKAPLPIYLVYFTAWEEDGTLKTVADVYGYDRRQELSSGV